MRRIRENFWPLVRFSLVGVANTGVYYGAYLVLLFVMAYLPAHLLAWFVSMTFSYLLNSWFTYRVPPTWAKFARFPLASLPNVLFTTFGVVLLIEGLRVSETVAPLIAGILAIPFSYLLAKLLLVGPSSPKSERNDAERGDPAERHAG